MKELIISRSFTHKSADSIEKYFREINKIDLLGGDEETELAKRIRQGDRSARDLLTTRNLKFVVSVAKQYQNQGLSFEDLICEGNIGLINAAKKFDETKGFKFISYAVWWIRQAISYAIANQVRIVHLPNNCYGLFNKLRKAESVLEQQFYRKPSPEEIAEYLDLPEERVVELIALSSKQVSVDQPLGVDKEGTLLDLLTGNENSVEIHSCDESKWSALKVCLNILNERERAVIIAFFGIGGIPPETLPSIAQRMNFSVDHTRRLRDTGLTRLRNSSMALRIKELLD